MTSALANSRSGATKASSKLGNDSVILASQIRAACGLLRWSATDLAERSGISDATIRRAESADGMPTMQTKNLAAIKSALEAGGVILVEENGEGPGVRWRKGRT